MTVLWLYVAEDVAGSVDSAVAVSERPSPAESAPPPASIVKQPSVSFDKAIGRKDSGRTNLGINFFFNVFMIYHLR